MTRIMSVVTLGRATPQKSTEVDALLTVHMTVHDNTQPGNPHRSKKVNEGDLFTMGVAPRTALTNGEHS